MAAIAFARMTYKFLLALPRAASTAMFPLFNDTQIDGYAESQSYADM